MAAHVSLELAPLRIGIPRWSFFLLEIEARRAPQTSRFAAGRWQPTRCFSVAHRDDFFKTVAPFALRSPQDSDEDKPWSDNGGQKFSRGPGGLEDR